MSARRGTSRPDQGDRRLSHDVRVWKLRPYQGRERTTYSVRWAVAGHEHHRTYQTRALADAERATLLSYVRSGAPFDITTGMPEPLLRAQRAVPWFRHACAYMDMKWPNVAPKTRKSIAESLTTVTPVLLRTERGRPDAKTLRRALLCWAFVSPRRADGPSPDQESAKAVAWLEKNTVTLADLADPTSGPTLIRSALDALARRLDGQPAAANTVARKRAVFYNALEYAVELGFLSANPVNRINWKAPTVTETLDPRVVVNAQQARALLAAVAAQGEMGRRLVAFFGCMYYAATRPGEAIRLSRDNLISLPTEGWGDLLLTRSMPRSGVAWSDTGASREERALKHRGAAETRPVPAHPELVKLLAAHVEAFGFGPGGRLFVGPYGGTLDESTYLRVWRDARKAALTPAEFASPLARRPYDLRHAAVSTWLNAGVPPTQVATWAGHSVAVLLKVYAKCVVGQDVAARRRIEDAMTDPKEPPKQPQKPQ